MLLFGFERAGEGMGALAPLLLIVGSFQELSTTFTPYPSSQGQKLSMNHTLCLLSFLWFRCDQCERKEDGQHQVHRQYSLQTTYLSNDHKVFFTEFQERHNRGFRCTLESC